MDQWTRITDAIHGVRLLTSQYQDDLIREKLTDRLDDVIQYYRTQLIPVSNEDILYRLFQQMHLISDDPYRIYQLAREQLDRATRAIGMFNEFGNNGKVFYNTFYPGHDLPEIVVAVDRPESYRLVLDWMMKPNDDWMDWSAVSIISHPFLDLDLQVPSREMKPKSLAYQGAIIIEVDVPLLVLQSYLWQQSILSKVDGITLSRRYFLYGYAYAPTLLSDMDVALRNRLRWAFENNPVIHQKNKNKWSKPAGRDVSSQLSHPHNYQYIDEWCRHRLLYLSTLGGVDISVWYHLMRTPLSHLLPTGINLYKDASQMALVRVSILQPHLYLLKEMMTRWQWQRWNTATTNQVKRAILTAQNQSYPNSIRKYPILSQQWKDLVEIWR